MKVKDELLALNAFLLLGFLYFMNLSFATHANLGHIAANYLFIGLLLNFGLIRFKELLNPISLLVPLCLAYLYYGLMLSDRQVELRPDVLASFYLFILFYSLGTFFPFARTNRRQAAVSKGKRIFVDVVFLTGLLVFLAEAAMNGGLPLLMVIAKSQDIYAEMRFIPVLHYLVMLIAVMPGVYYYFYRNSYLSKNWLYINSILSLFVILNTLSRQLIVFGLLSYLIVYMKLNNLGSVKTVMKWTLGAGISFLLLGQVRILAQKDSISPLEFLKAYSGVPNDIEINTFDATFNLYTSLNFITLNDIYAKAEKLHLGMYTFKPFWVLLHYDKAFSFDYLPDLDGLVRLGTVLSDPYLDFGIPGVILFSFLYGVLLSGAFFLHTRSRNLGHSLMWASLSYAMVMSVFANYFNVMFIWISIAFSLCLCFGFSFGSKAQAGSS